MENWSLTMSVGFLVWMSGSLCLIHPPLSIWFSPPHLILFISWVLLLLNRYSSYTTRHCVKTERFLSAIQIYSATPTVHLRTLTWMPYLEPVPFMHFVLLLTLWKPDTVVEPQRKPYEQLCNVFFISVCSLFPYSNYLLLQKDCEIIWSLLLLKSGLLCVFTLPLFSPLPRPLLLRPLPLSGDGDEEHALLSHGVCQEWGDLWWVTYKINETSILKTLSHPVYSSPSHISCTKKSALLRQ